MEWKEKTKFRLTKDELKAKETIGREKITNPKAVESWVITHDHSKS